MTSHDLKCWPGCFADIMAYDKTFEVRKNDRDFKVGDILILREWDPSRKDYTGAVTRREVTYVISLELFGIPGFVAMGIQPAGLPAGSRWGNRIR